jgi:hypothetical protein
VNRSDFQQLARIRLREAQALLDAGHYDGAYDLAGYAVECALKACIAKQTQRYDFPDRGNVNKSYSHDFAQLVEIAGLREFLVEERRSDPIFAVHWNIAMDWLETSRYERVTEQRAVALVSAVQNPRHGVLRWLRKHW